MNGRLAAVSAIQNIVKENASLLYQMGRLLQREELRGMVLSALREIGTPEAERLAGSAPATEEKKISEGATPEQQNAILEMMERQQRERSAAIPVFENIQQG